MIKILVLASLLIALLNPTESLRIHNQRKPVQNARAIPPFKTFWMTQQLDHFNFRDDRTFQHRYLINGRIFKKYMICIIFY